MAGLFNLIKNNMGLKLLLYKYRRLMFKYSGEYHRFCEDKSERRLIFISDIDHGNLGDHAIVYAEHKLLEDIEQQYTVYSFERKYCLSALDFIVNECRNTDTIVVPGGGWVGTLWEASGELFTKIIENLGHLHIIVFPQTIFFEDTVYGQDQKQRLYYAIQNCEDLVFCVRDRNSYDFLLRQMPNQNEKIKYFLYPDIVLSLKPDIKYMREKKLLIVMRKDKEKTIKDAIVEQYLSLFEKKGYQLVSTDTVLSGHVKPESRENALYEKWKEFASSKLVMTDRLHGMIFSVITNTPCIVFDNSSHKVRGVYIEWLKDFPLIYFVSENKTNVQGFLDYIDKLPEQSESYEINQLEKIFSHMKAIMFHDVEDV